MGISWGSRGSGGRPLAANVCSAEVVSERLTAGLEYDRQPAASVVVAAGQPLLRVRREGRRAGVDLVLLGGDRTIEVSFHPSAANGLVRERARRDGHDPNGWAGALTTAIRADAGTWALACEPDDDLLRLLGAITHPVLAAAYAGGAATIDEVPRWAVPALRRSTAAGAASTWFGAAGATRTVVRALATTLTDLPGSWWNLGLAVAAAPVLEPDDLARCLAGGGASPATDVAPPTADDLRVAAEALRLLGRDRSRRLVAGSVQDGSASALVSTLRLLLEVQRDVRWPVPATRDELQRVCLQAASLDPDPTPGPRPLPPHPIPATPAVAPPGTQEEQQTARAGAVAVVTAQPAATTPPASAAPVLTATPRPAWGVARRAPEVRRPAPPGGHALRHGDLALRLAAQGLAGRYDLVLPRSGDELAAWGRVLGNCLGDFAAAVAGGATIVVGVREAGMLVAAFEVRCRQLVQLLGHRNRPVPRRLAAAVTAHVDAVLRSLPLP